MTTLTILPADKTVDVSEGVRLIDALAAAGAPITCRCEEAKPVYDPCHIFVQQGRKGVSRMTPAENERLDQMVGVGSKSRLACQVTVLGAEDVTVELLGFSSGL